MQGRVEHPLAIDAAIDVDGALVVVVAAIGVVGAVADGCEVAEDRDGGASLLVKVGVAREEGGLQALRRERRTERRSERGGGEANEVRLTARMHDCSLGSRRWRSSLSVGESVAPASPQCETGL